MAEATFTDGVLTVPFELDPGVPGWPKITGTVRPATSLEFRKHDARVGALQKAAESSDPVKDPVGYENTISMLVDQESEFYAQHIAAWSIGEVSPAAVRKLPPQYFNKLDPICFQGVQILGNSDGTSAS